MKSIVKCIYSYYETLLGIWNTWNDGILYGHFPEGANSFTEALGINTSDGRSRAKEIYRIGLLKKELTKGTSGLEYISKGNNIQSDLGYVSALISKAARLQRTSAIDKALSSLCAIYAIIQPVKIDDLEFSINTLIQRFDEIYPCPQNIDFRKWHRYLLSAFLCEISYREEKHYIPEEKIKDSKAFLNFIIGQGECPSLTIRTNEKNGYQARKTIKSAKDVSDAILEKISLTNIIQQKSPLFILGDEKDENPKGFYGMAIKHSGRFLRSCYEIEKVNISNSPFAVFYDEDTGDSKKGNVLKGLAEIFEQQNDEVKSEYKQLMKSIYDGAVEALEILDYHPKSMHLPQNSQSHIKYLTALRTKPFLLLAGISGTGKSRIVRKLAQATITKELQGYDGTDFEEKRWTIHRPKNFELIQVKPNWHTSMDVVGYISSIPEPHYVFTPFVEFVVRAWLHPEVPFFLCLDEMNLAPVEEYFAEYLSAIESRSFEDGQYITDPIIKPFSEFGEKVCDDMKKQLFPKFDATNLGKGDPIEGIVNHLVNRGLTLPPNLMVVGTVNMDETTFSFSRKVLDRAMSIEMNEVDYDSFLADQTDNGLIALVEQIEDSELDKLLVNRHIEAKEFVDASNEDALFVIKYLKRINSLLEGTPFKLGYRAANEALIFLQSCKDFGLDNKEDAMNDFTLMKVLSRIEGDETKLRITDSETDQTRLNKAGISQIGSNMTLLDGLRLIIVDTLGEFATSKQTQVTEGSDEVTEDEQGTDQTVVIAEQRTSIKKLDAMVTQLSRDHFVSYWN